MPHLVFIKKQDEGNPYDTVTMRMSSTAETLPEVLENFKSFLQACGFHFGDDQDIVVGSTADASELERD